MNSIYHIFKDGDFCIQEIIQAIETDYKNYDEINKEVIDLKRELQTRKSEKIIETKIIPKIQKQEIITVAGTEGAGKSLFAKQIAVAIAKKSEFKVLVIDFNTANGNLHYFFGIDSMPAKPEYILPKEKASSISYMADAIDKRTFDNKIFEKYTMKINGINNLDIITGNASAYICKNVLDVEHYMRILEKAKQMYDFIIIDTSSNIFLDSTRFSLSSATKVFFLTEGNIPSVFRSKRIFDEIYNKWEIKNEKIEVVINKYDKGSLDKSFIKEAFKEINNVKFIKYNYKYNEIGNMSSNKIFEDEDYLQIIQEFNVLPKETFNSKIKKYIGKLLEKCYQNYTEVEHVN